MTLKLVRLAAGVSLAALAAASVASAQTLANPVTPAVTDAAEKPPEPLGNFLRPRAGVQAAVTDNVTSATSNEKSDIVSRFTVGADARYESPRSHFNLSGDVFYDVYAETKKFDTLAYRGTADAAIVLVPDVLALEAAGVRTQGSLTTFGTTDFFRSANANDYQLGTYYVGPHVTFSPGVLDVSAAARYSQVFYEGPKSTTFQNLSPETSQYQLIGAADTKDRLGKYRFVGSAQYQEDDAAFQSTSGSASNFFDVNDRFTAIARVGYDDLKLSNTINLNAPFWSLGGQYVLNERANLRLEGGQRYDRAYWSGTATARLSRVTYLFADYSNTLAPGAFAVNNVLVDYVGKLNEPLPIPIAPPPFSLNNNFYNQPSINRSGSVRALFDFGRQSVDVAYTSVQQRFLTATAQSRTQSQSVTYTNLLRPDLTVSLGFLHAAERVGGQLVGGATADRRGSYYLTTARAEYHLNRRTTLTAMYQNRQYRPSAITLLQEFDENIASIALVRQFR